MNEGNVQWVGGCLSCAKEKTNDKLFLCCALRENAQQTIFLSNVFSLCAVEKTHDKALLCRAPEKMHAAKFQTHGKEGVSGSVCR
jgi:hypothetical protein